MSINNPYPISEEEISQILVTQDPFWNSIRSPSEQSTPSISSDKSFNISEVSHFSLTSTPASNPIPAESHPNLADTSSNNLSPILFNPSTSLQLPDITMPTVSSGSTYTIPPLTQMPIRGSKQAPSTFRGDYQEVGPFINHYNRLLDYYHVTSETDKCQGILEYCSQKVKDFIQICPYYITPDWKKLEKEILDTYDDERMKTRVRPKDLLKYVKQIGHGRIVNLTQWKKYHRNYIAMAGFLKQNKLISELEYNGYYWYGIPSHLQGVFELRLQAKNPAFDTSQPWRIQDIQEIAEIYFKRTKYTNQLPHLPALGFAEEEDEYDESDDDFDNDSDDSDSDDDRYRCRRHKSSKKKKKKKSRQTKQEFNPTQILAEKPSQNIISPPEDNGVDTLIQKLNIMSLEDPHYGALYYQAVSKDPSGLVAECIIRKPKQISTSQPMRETPPHQNSRAPPYNNPRNPDQQGYPRGIYSRVPNMQNPSKCFGCFDIGHSLRDCPKMAQLINRGVVTLDPQTFKYCLPDGQPLFRKPEECLVDTINRVRPSPPQGTVQFATLREQVQRYYRKNLKRAYLQYSYSDTEDDDEDEYDLESDSDKSKEEDEDEYDEGHWTNKFKQRKRNPICAATVESYDEDDDYDYDSYHRKCQEDLDKKEYPTYMAYNDSENEEKAYQSYPAERAEKGRTTRQARDAAMNNPIKRSQLDGVYMPPRKFTRSMEKLPETVSISSKNTAPARQSARLKDHSKEKEDIPEIPVRKQISIDTRKPRFEEVPDITMEEPVKPSKLSEEPKKTIVLQDYTNRNKASEEKNPEIERTRTGPRQSDLSTQVNSKEVVEQILDTQVSLPLRKILGASKELSFTLQDVMRYKNPVNKSTPNPTSQKVYNTQVEKLESVAEELRRIKKRLLGREVSENRSLIQVEFDCGAEENIIALIDTGSQLNVARREAAEEKICLPIEHGNV